MRYIISRYNHDIAWLKKYTNDYVLYDRSEKPIEGSIIVPNVGSDILDKFSYIIDHYENLPECILMLKANIFKYITQDEFDKLQYNRVYTPLLTQNHATYRDARGQVCFYHNGIYYERNDYWFLNRHPAKYAAEIIGHFGMDKREFNAFAPGSNYILPKENILKHSKETYIKLRSYLDWTVYPGDAQLMERNLHYLWQ